MSGNDEKESGNPFPGPSESESAFKRYPELYENDEVIKRQMEMISESLAACKRMSKRRSPKNEVDEVVIPETGSSNDERRQYHGHPDVRDDSSPVVSYILKEKIESLHEILQEGQEFHSLSSPKTSSSQPEVSQTSNSSQIGLYKPDEVDPTKMLEVIQRELNVLLKLAPVLSSVVDELFSTIRHYQSCSQCKAKIRSSLPWILNTVQELVKHLTKKRRETYVWPNELSYLRLRSIYSREKESFDKEEVEKNGKRKIVLGKLEKVDAIIASDAKPGLQIQLEVRPEKTKKKFLERKVKIPQNFEANLVKRYPTESPKESSYHFLLRVERPSRPPEVSWRVKRSVWVSKGFASAVLFLQRFTCLRILSGFVLVPVSWLTYQLERHSNGVDDGEAEMQVERMKELEAEVKGLKDLMMEVHTNQMELSNVLMEKGVSSRTIVRLTDPKMLEEENEVVRKATMMEVNQPAASTETLQRTVDDLKRKCAVKNRMIVTLLKGLRTDIPNEWWEELVDYVFTDSKSNEGLEPDKVAELLRQTSAYRQMKKVPIEPMPATQEKEKPSEASQENRSLSQGGSSKDDQEFSDASSRPETVNQNDTVSESEYKTGSENWSEECGDQVSKRTANGLTEIWETSSFVQKLLYEDSQTGVSVVDLFVALKSAKNSIDNLSILNDTIHEKLVSLSHDTGLVQTGYENLIQMMAFFFDRLQEEESRTEKSESETVSTPTESIHQPEVDIARENSATEIGRFCSSCGFVKYLPKNVTCPLCKGDIIVREKCSDCVAVEQSEMKAEKKCESCRLSICEYCGLPELRDKKTESKILDEIEIKKETGNEENVKIKLEEGRKRKEEEQGNCVEVQTSAPEEPKPSSPRPSSVALSYGDSIPSQTSKVVESFFEMLMGHVFKSEEGSKSTTATRESLLSSLLTSKSGIVLSQEDSKKLSEGTMSLSDTTVQMICEICGILGMIEPQEHPVENTSTASDKAPKLDEKGSSHNKDVRERQLPTVSDTRTNEKHRNSIITIYVPKSLTTKHEGKEPEQPNKEPTGSGKASQPETPETEESCDEEIFEEALSEPYSGLRSPATSRCANCMGDKKEMKVRKSVSTLTATNDFMSSWIGKITEDIKTKIRNMKPRSKQISVTDERSSGEVSKKLPPALEFTISANTPVGVFDVTIRQYKDTRRKLKDGPFRDVIPDGSKIIPVEMKTFTDGDRYWSNESLLLSDSDHLDLVSSSGVIPLHATSSHPSGFLFEEEMEEFIEVYVQSRNKTVSTSGSVSKREKGFIAEMSLLHVNPQFMEMVICQPKSFIQEIIPKTGKFVLKKDGGQEESERKEEEQIPEEEVNAGSMLAPGKGGKDDDEDQDSQDDAGSPNNSEVLSRSFNDLVISIQIDVDDQEEAEESSKTNNQIYIDLKVGGQDGQNFKGKECVYLISKGEIAQLAEGAKDNVKDIWKNNVLRSLEDSERVMDRGRITFKDTPIMIDKGNSTEADEDDQQEEVESKSFESIVSNDSESKTSMREKSVIRDESPEEEIKEIILDPELEEEPKAKTWGTACTILPIQKPNQVEVRYLQHKRLNVLTLDPRTPTLTFFLTRTDNELQKALDLIQEIETNIVKVKLSEAILILPVLESELRKHLREKMKGMTGRRSSSRETSVDNFFSAPEVISSEEVTESSPGSEERFQYLLKLLSDLEEAVKSNVYSKEQICEHSSSRIYNLLHALTNNIRGLEDDTTMSQISETVDIASQLDTAVRKFDDIIKRKPTDYAKELIEGKPEEVVKDEHPMKNHLTNVRKRVFEMVEVDAIETEERIEMDFDRIDRLERENEESMKFVEAFLEKTLRRSSELTNLRTELKNLSSVLSDLYEELSKAKQRRESSLKRSSSPPTKEVPVRDTVSSLLLALDDLKTRAREKNEACKEILNTIASATSIKRLALDRKSLMSSKSSYATKSTEGVMSSVTEFKKIGQRSLYLAWSKPEGSLSDSIVGYEILVNGKLNQKVRNPQRQQAVLYSVDLSHSAEVQLHGLLDNGSKVLLAIVTYLDL